MRRKRPRPTRRKAGRAKLGIMVFVSLLLASVIFVMYTINGKLLPTVIEVTSIKVLALINSYAAEAVNAIAAERGLQSQDFYIKTEDINGKIYSLSVNTLLVNEVCADIAERLSEKLVSLNNEKIEIPLGSVFGLGMFSNMGSMYTVIVHPRGTAVVDYESEFVSAGINQINFQIWLNVKAVAEIINPLQGTQIEFTRRIALVNTIITGEIPGTYLNITPEK